MSIYQPNWLMVKQHNQTGLKYFCKTTKKNPYKYNGSGKYWLNHLKVHGTDITTLWCHLYESKEELVDDAVAFSVTHNIVRELDTNNKKVWANEILENGLDGSPPGVKKKPLSDEQKKRHSIRMSGEGNSMFGRNQTEEAKKVIGDKSRGKKRSDDVKKAMSVARSGEGNSMYGRRGENSPHFGKKRPEFGLSQSGVNNSFYGKKHSEQTKIALSGAKPKFLCPHCQKIVGGQSNYNRWHGDNCKTSRVGNILRVVKSGGFTEYKDDEDV